MGGARVACSAFPGETAHPLRLGDRIAGQHEHSGAGRVETAGTGAGDASR